MAINKTEESNLLSSNNKNENGRPKTKHQHNSSANQLCKFFNFKEVFAGGFSRGLFLRGAYF